MIGRAGLWTVGVTALAALSAGCGAREPLAPSVVYGKVCARCHGDDGRGVPRELAEHPEVNLLVSDMLAAGDRQAVAERIRHGRGRMPAFEDDLTTEEIDTLAAWTLEQFAPNPPEETP